MNTSPQLPINSIIAIVETILLFFVGILGNKIAEMFEISTTVVLVLAGIGLLILSMIGYKKSANLPRRQQPPDTNQVTTQVTMYRYIPNTMISVFPFGTIVGLIIGAFIPSVGFTSEILQSRTLMQPYEFAGIFLGIIMGVLFAMAIDNRLSASFVFGYAISLATAIQVVDPQNSVWVTYLAYTFGFGVFSIVLIIAEPLFKRLKKMASEPRF